MPSLKGRVGRGKKVKPPRRQSSAFGDCYEAAINFVMQDFDCVIDKVGCKYHIVHAEVLGQGPLEGVPFGHGFVIDTEDDMVIDTSNGRNIRMPRAVYFAIGRIDEIGNYIEYTFKEAADKMVETRHYGPWDLETSTGF